MPCWAVTPRAPVVPPSSNEAQAPRSFNCTAYSGFMHALTANAGPAPGWTGRSDVFADNLPGGPDNVTTSPDGIYWVALPGGPPTRATADRLMPHPFLRRPLMRAPDHCGRGSPGSGTCWPWTTTARSC